MAAALEQLASSGEPVLDEDLVHLSPTLHEHINPYGKYRFDVDDGLSRSGPASAASAGRVVHAVMVRRGADSGQRSAGPRTTITAPEESARKEGGVIPSRPWTSPQGWVCLRNPISSSESPASLGGALLD